MHGEEPEKRVGIARIDDAARLGSTFGDFLCHRVDHRIA